LIFYFVLFSRLPHSLAFEISREKEQILQEDKLNGKREDLAMAGIQLEKKKLVKIVPIILFCVLMDIALHLVTNEYSTMPKNPNYSKLVGLLGTEITVTIWSLLAFSTAANVYFRAQNSIHGVGLNKGLRYGSAIALLWLFAMMEGVSLFGNSIINEFIVGLSDAIPVLVMSILLSLLEAKKKDNPELKPFTISQKIMAVCVFSLIFLCGRYLAYFTQAIKSGYQTSPSYTFFWTLLMGGCIGIVCILLGNAGNTLSLERRTVIFGVLIFGVNWAAFLIFMPLLFSGYLMDVLIRIFWDILIATIGYYLTYSIRIDFLKNSRRVSPSRSWPYLRRSRRRATRQSRSIPLLRSDWFWIRRLL
jgi:hypothetical protein